MSRSRNAFIRYLNSSPVLSVRASHAARAFVITQRSFAHTATTPPFSTHDFQQRVDKLEGFRDAVPDFHPRLTLKSDTLRLTPSEFHEKFGNVQKKVQDVKVEVFGRITSLRIAGSRLVFLDIRRGGVTVQVLCNERIITQSGGERSSFKAFKGIARKGDWFSAVGHPTVTPSGTVSIEVTETPTCLAPSLHQIPDDVENEELLARRPHVKSLVNSEAHEILILRHYIKDAVMNYMKRNDFIEVETPMLEVGVAGAIARRFDTTSTEISRAKLHLRIAPELSLKRLIIGGQERVFEIGKVFRNEGVDMTHNPEFTICEFYEVGATLEDLMKRTQDLFVEIASRVEDLRTSRLNSLSRQHIEINSEPWKRLPFIPTIEAAINRKLPIFSDEGALSELQDIFQALHIPLPPDITIPRLLEELEDRYIIPLCTSPTFVTHHPECLSPLAKTFVDLQTGQRVAARAELHIEGREYVNCYEEENSPWEQRRKFTDQATMNEPNRSCPAEIDVSYLEALEWGMPPTGGWGCGVDRLVMLFANKRRIADVLPFGNLRNTIAISGNGKGRK